MSFFRTPNQTPFSSAESSPSSAADQPDRKQLSNHGIMQLDDGRILLALSHYHALKH